MSNGEAIHYERIVSEWGHNGPFNIESLTKESILVRAGLSEAHTMGLNVGEPLKPVLVFSCFRLWFYLFL